MAPEGDAAAISGAVIDRFGGIRPMATKLATPVTTVQGWKKRGIIPQIRHAEILSAAAREGIAIDPAELAATDPSAVGRPEIRMTEPAPDPRPDRPAPAPVQPIPPATLVVRRGSTAAYSALTISLLVAVAVTGAGFAGWYFYLEPLRAKVTALEAGSTNGDLAQRVAKLEAGTAQPASAPATGDADRLAALEKQLADLKAGSAQTEQLAKGLSDLQIAAGGRELLAQSIRDIQSSVAGSQGEIDRLSTQVTAFGTRLDQVDTQLADRRQQALRAEAVVLAVGQLRTALATSKPFAKEIAALRTLVAGDTEMLTVLDPIQSFADSGVPTGDDLTSDFKRLAPTLVRSAIVGNGQGWWRQALYHLESVISIRRVGDDVPGDTTDAVTARAEGKLDEDDLPGAISALQALAGVPAELASPWIHDAGHRVAVNSADSDLTRIALGRLGTGTHPVAPVPAAPAAPPAPAPAK